MSDVNKNLGIDDRTQPPFEPPVVRIEGEFRAEIPAEVYIERGRGTSDYNPEAAPETERIQVLIGFDADLGPELVFEVPDDPERRLYIALEDVFRGVAAVQYWQRARRADPDAGGE